MMTLISFFISLDTHVAFFHFIFQSSLWDPSIKFTQSLRASGKDNITIAGHSWANCSTWCFEGSSTVKQQSGKTQLIFIEMVVH